MTNKLVSEIRFDGFWDEWKKCKLGDVSEIKTGPFGSTLHANDYVEDGIPIVTTEHFKSGSLPTTKSGIPQVSDYDYHRLKSYILEKGDIVFSRVGSVDINALVTSTQEGWLFSGRVLRVRLEKSYYGYFMHYLLETTSVKNNVLSRAVGQTMPSINTEILKDTPIVISRDDSEQKKIGEFFKNLDDRIALQQQHITLLKESKQGFLQKMFPKDGERVPEVRFDGFSGEWEKCILGEILKVNSGRDYKHLNIGEIPVFGTGGYMLSVDDKLSDSDAIGIGRKGTIDKPQYLQAPFWTVDTLFYLTPKNHNKLHFLYQIAYIINWKSFSEQTGVPSLSRATIEKIPAIVPSEAEQQKIGEFFKNLDDSIETHEKELELLQETKKGFLQKMFV